MFKVKYTKDGKIHTVYKVQCLREPLHDTYFLIFIESDGIRLGHWKWVYSRYCVPVD